MIAHYTQAAMVAENRRLAVPASVDSIPTTAMQEDHVSMGWAAARKLRAAVANLARILAVELSRAARGLDLRAPLTPAAGTARRAARPAGQVRGPGPDRWLAPELAGGRAAGRVRRAAGRRRRRHRTPAVSAHRALVDAGRLWASPGVHQTVRGGAEWHERFGGGR